MEGMAGLRELEIAALRGDPGARVRLAEMARETLDDRVLWAHLHPLYLLDGAHEEAIGLLVARIVEDGWTHDRATMLWTMFRTIGIADGLIDFKARIRSMLREYGRDSWVSRRQDPDDGYAGDIRGAAWLFATELDPASSPRAPCPEGSPTVDAYVAADAQVLGDPVESYARVSRLEDSLGGCAFVAAHRLQHCLAFDDGQGALGYASKLSANVRENWLVNFHLCRALHLAGDKRTAKARLREGLRRHPHFYRLARVSHWLGRPRWLWHTPSVTALRSRAVASMMSARILEPLRRCKRRYWSLRDRD
jgi:hypothetical protein